MWKEDIKKTFLLYPKLRNSRPLLFHLSYQYENEVNDQKYGNSLFCFLHSSLASFAVFRNMKITPQQNLKAKQLLFNFNLVNLIRVCSTTIDSRSYSFPLTPLLSLVLSLPLFSLAPSMFYSPLIPSQSLSLFLFLPTQGPFTGTASTLR